MNKDKNLENFVYLVGIMLDAISGTYEIVHMDNKFQVTYVVEYDEDFEPIFNTKDLGELFKEVMN